MDNKFKMIIAFAMGALAGAGASSVAWRVATRGKTQKAVESALEAQRGLYEEHISKCEKKAEEESEDEEFEEAEGSYGRATQEEVEGQASIIQNEGYATRAETDAAPVEDYYDASPYLIRADQYHEERLTYEKVELDYWAPDMTLTDENDEVLTIPDTVGYRALDEFRKDGDLSDIYVRNDPQGTDYHVVRQYMPYSLGDE